MFLLSIRVHKLFEGQKALFTFSQFLETLKNTKFHITEVCINVTSLIYHLWVVPKWHMISNSRYYHSDVRSLGCAQLPQAPKLIELCWLHLFYLDTWSKSVDQECQFSKYFKTVNHFNCLLLTVTSTCHQDLILAMLITRTFLPFLFLLFRIPHWIDDSIMKKEMSNEIIGSSKLWKCILQH